MSPKITPKSLPKLDVHAGVGVADYEIVCSNSDEPDKPWHKSRQVRGVEK